MQPVLTPCIERWGKVELRDTLPDTVTHTDVVYVPYNRGSAWGIFGQDGVAVDGSVDLHGPNANTHGQLLRWDGVAEEAPETEYIYAGVFNPHYGHFLINSLSRLWPLAAEERPAARLLFHGGASPADWFTLPFVRDIFGALGLNPGDIAVFSRPARIGTLVVPCTSFQEQHFIHRVYAALGHRIGARLLQGWTPRVGLPPVYLSKTGLTAGVGRVINEAVLEERLQGAGVEIVRPETLSFPEQVALFAERPAVLGTSGSGFHSSIFVPPQAKLLLLNPSPGPNSNLLLIDAANGNIAEYLYASGTKVVQRAGDSFLTSFCFPDPIEIADALLQYLDLQPSPSSSAGASMPAASQLQLCPLAEPDGTLFRVRGSEGGVPRRPTRMPGGALGPAWEQCAMREGKLTYSNEFAILRCSPCMETHYDVVYMPVRDRIAWEQDPTWGIYDLDGRLIDAAAYYRGVGKNLVGQSSHQDLNDVDVEDAPPGRYLYGGNIISHYGHFLLSTLSRLWIGMNADLSSYKIVCHGAGTPQGWLSHPFIREIFEAIGIGAHNLVVFKRPTRLRAVDIPRPSCEEHNFVHYTFASWGHAVGNALLREQNLPTGDAPIWFAKTEMKHLVQGAVNEAELMHILGREGVEGIDPHKISVKQQVALYRTRRAILGTTSSAFHTSILQPPTARMLAVNLGPKVNSNCGLVDQVNKNRISYFYPEVEKLGRYEGDGRKFDFAYKLKDPASVAGQLLKELGI